LRHIVPTANSRQIDASFTTASLNPAYQLSPPSSNYITAKEDDFNQTIISPLIFGDCDYPVTSPSTNASFHQVFPNQSDPTVTGGHLNSIYATSNHGLQNQISLTANGRQINADFDSSLDSVQQWAPPDSNDITANGDHFNDTFIYPFLNFNDETFPYPNAIIDGQSDATIQPSNLSINSDFDDSGNFNSSALISTTTSELNISISADAQTTDMHFTKLPLPAVSTATAVASTNVNTNRFKCDQPSCTTTFTRAGDLSRHMKKHGPPEHACPVDGCNRKGDNAFYRLDKLQDHQRKKHKMSV
jgi:hypothetical protein